MQNEPHVSWKSQGQLRIGIPEEPISTPRPKESLFGLDPFLMRLPQPIQLPLGVSMCRRASGKSKDPKGPYQSLFGVLRDPKGPYDPFF